MFMLKSKSRKIKESIPVKFRGIIKELEDVTHDGQTEAERMNAYMAIFAKLPPAEHQELIIVLQRTRHALAEASHGTKKAGNRAQRRARKS